MRIRESTSMHLKALLIFIIRLEKIFYKRNVFACLISNVRERLQMVGKQKTPLRMYT